MASAPGAHTVKVHIEFDEDTTAIIKRIVRDELAVFAGIATYAAVDRRDA